MGPAYAHLLARQERYAGPYAGMRRQRLLLNHEQTRRRSGRSSPLTTASGIANAAPVC